MEQYILAIDQGTTSTRAIIFDHEANIIALAQKEIQTYYPKPGWVEQSADEIYASMIGVVWEALTKASLQASDIASIGITNQRETTVVWDKKTGKPVHFALVWQSRQSNEICDELRTQNKEKMIREKTGLLIDPYFSATKIRWILDHIENGQARAEAGELLFGTIDTWLVYKLTEGKVHISDVSNASRMMLMNIHTCAWDQELLDLLQIPEIMLPTISDTSTVYGCTDPKIFNTPIPIGAVVGDQQAALFGQACFSKGSVKNTYGTGCFLLMNIGNTPLISSHGLVTTVAWKIGNEVVYALEGSVFVAGAAIQWLRDGLKIISSASMSEEKAMSVTSSEGVYVVPSFVGLGAPYWKQDVKGAIFGLTRGCTEAHLTRATLESLAFQTYDVLEAMENDAQFTLKSLKVDGGACRNNFLMQFQADLIQKEVHRPLINETTALGATFLAGLAVGYWKDITEIEKLWHRDTVFTPVKNDLKREERLNGWKRAIEATCKF